MGTRNLTMVIHKEETKVAQYGQWDGYPSGQGLTVLEFLKNSNMDVFKKKLENVRFSNDDDIKKMNEFLLSIGAQDGWVNLEQSKKYNEQYPYMSRDVGAEILNMIYESDGEVLLQDSSSFASDSLFCEWAYVIDIDKNQLEVYKGFNHSELEDGQRFKNLEKQKYPIYDDYYPIRCVKMYPLDELPTNDVFVEELNSKEEEE